MSQTIINSLPKVRILLGFCLLTVLSFLLFQSCSDSIIDKSEEIVSKSLIITDSNLEKLKNESLQTYANLDFSSIFEPDYENTNYEKILEILNQEQGIENIDYQTILGEYYEEKYFNQLSSLLEYSKNIILSDLFNSSSNIEEREVYLIDILTHVFLENNKKNQSEKSTSSCLSYYNSCKAQAKRDHGTRLISCTGIATVAALYTGGAGALSWPICMVTSGFLYSSAMTGCSEAYDICRQQQ